MSDGVEELPHRTSLDDEAAAEFVERRGRIARRFRSWRSNFAAVGDLLESDPERAAALAGNYATEAEAVLEAWLEAMVGASGDRLTEEEVEAWWQEVHLFLERWERRARDAARTRAWGDEATRRFQVVLGELLERAEERTADLLREAREPSESVWMRWVRKASQWFARLFRPDRPGDRSGP